jgi:transposase
LGQSPRTVQYWVRRFNEGGFDALREGEHLGRPTSPPGL